VHVALITTSYPDDTPGSEAAGSFVADFATELSKHVKVTVVAAATASSRTSDAKLDVIRFRVPRAPLSLLNPLNPLHWVAILKTLHAGRGAVSRLVDEDSPDYLFALWALPSGHWAASAGRHKRIPFGVWALGSDIWGAGRLPLIRSILRQVLRNASHRFADGIALGEQVEQISGSACTFLPSTRVLPSLEPRVKPSSAPYKLGFLGRWHRNKGVDILLDALQQLSAQDWDRIAAVRICGGGPLCDEVHRAVQRLRGAGHPVQTGGYLDKQAAAEFIDWADYLVVPSRIESIPVIFSDAMQIGTPIIATPVGDLPQLHRKYGFGLLAAAAAPRDVAASLQAALKGDASAYATGIAAAAGDFDIEAIVQSFVAQTGQVA
jgi:glycosyltransferase involved in cell wall biosynthesis